MGSCHCFFTAHRPGLPQCDSLNPTALGVRGQYTYITAGKFALCNLCIHLPYAPFTQVGNMGVGRII